MRAVFRLSLFLKNGDISQYNFNALTKPYGNRCSFYHVAHTRNVTST